MNKRKRRVRRLLLMLALDIVVFIIILFIIYSAICGNEKKIPYIGRYAILFVETPSMEPAIPSGSYVLVERPGKSVFSVGDVVVFNSRDTEIYGFLNTHRIVESVRNDSGELLYYITKGDGNAAADEFVTYPQDIVGVYKENLPKVTSFVKFVMEKLVFIIMIAVVLMSIATFIMNIAYCGGAKKTADDIYKEELERLRREGLPKETGKKDASVNAEEEGKPNV